MAIHELTNQERTERAAAYLKRSLSDLRSLATTMGLSTEGRKVEIINRILDRGAKAEIEKHQVDMSGLYIRY
jgi:hypothetical protein